MQRFILIFAFVAGLFTPALADNPLSARQEGEVMRLLHALGFDPGPVGSKPGPATEAAIRRFEDHFGFEQAGRMSRSLLIRLNRISKWDGRAGQGYGEQFIVTDRNDNSCSFKVSRGARAVEWDGLCSRGWPVGTGQLTIHYHPDYSAPLVESYSGAFSKGQIDGPGTYTFADGIALRGKWKQGRLVWPDRPPSTTIASVDVLEIQRQLLMKGFDPGPVDGLTGRRTIRAIQEYQQSAGLPVDGKATSRLLRQLRASIGASNQSVAPAGALASGTGNEFGDGVLMKPTKIDLPPMTSEDREQLAVLQNQIAALSPAPPLTRAQREAANQLLDEGYKQYQADNMEEAQRNFDMALQIDPDNSLAHFYAADIYQASGRIHDMKQSWLKAATLGHDTAHGVRARLKLENWNATHDQAGQPKGISAYANLNGRWCRMSEEVGHDRIGLWIATTVEMLDIRFERKPGTDYFRQLTYITDTGCHEGYKNCNPPPHGLYGDVLERKCSSLNCFDYGYYPQKLGYWPEQVVISYGQGDEAVVVEGPISQSGDDPDLTFGFGCKRDLKTGRRDRTKYCAELYSGFKRCPSAKP